MPYEIAWYTEQRVMSIRLYGSVTLDDMERMTQESIDYVTNGSGPVHAIVSQYDVESMPHNLPALLKSMKPRRQPNSGFTVVVTKNPVTRFLGSALFQAVGLEMRTAATFEDALAILRNIDPTLDGLAAEATGYRSPNPPDTTDAAPRS